MLGRAVGYPGYIGPFGIPFLEENYPQVSKKGIDVGL
jgi:hypothetical protein